MLLVGSFETYLLMRVLVHGVYIQVKSHVTKKTIHWILLHDAQFEIHILNRDTRTGHGEEVCTPPLRLSS